MRKTNIINRLIFIFLFTLLLISCNIVTGDSLVDPDTIKDWSNAYLDEYMKIVEENFGHEYGYYFEFYGQHPIEIKSIIAENGVAITMIPNPNINKNLFEIKFTENSIERAVFDYNELNCSIATDIDSELYLKLNWGGEADRHMFIFNNSVGKFSYGIITTNQGHFIRLIGESEVTLSNMIVDNISYDFVYLNSCIKKDCWSTESAKKIANAQIKNVSLMNSFLIALNSDEFKEFLAYPELESMLIDIKDNLEKKRNDRNYNYTIFQWESDLKEVDDIAFNKYGITNEFLQKIIKFVDVTYIPPSNNLITNQENNIVWFDVFSLFFISLIIFFLMGILYNYESKENKIIKIPLGVLLALFGIFYFYYITKSEIGFYNVQIYVPFFSIIVVWVVLRRDFKFIIKLKRR